MDRQWILLAAYRETILKFISEADPTENLITVFDSKKPPSVSLKSYIERIFRYANCSIECFVISLIYLKRILKFHPNLYFTELNIHRFIVTSIMIGVKAHEDRYFTNKFYAEIGGIKPCEMNNLEMEFLVLLNFDIGIPVNDFANCQKDMMEYLASILVQNPLEPIINENEPKNHPNPSPIVDVTS